jgi:Bacterial extracellular solute-binding protein
VIFWRANWRNTRRSAGAWTSRAMGSCLGSMLMLLLHGHALAASVEWPAFGPDRDYLHFKGFANAVPDFVGPIDGSAKLTIFTEGNHFPVLLPLTLETFPAWCLSTRACNVPAGKILIVTLPQPMIIDVLLKGGVRLGNAVLPVGRSERVFPSIVMGGRAPLAQLAAAGVVQKKARVFARHRGLGLLVRRDLLDITELKSFSSHVRRLVIASESEAGARNQYVATLKALVGGDATNDIMSREVRSFSGRMGIQHRDVPFAILNGIADGGIIFSHLAAFYASRYPEQLRYVPVPAAEQFGQEIAIARTTARQGLVAEAFTRFFLEAARTAYPANGFAATTSFDYGQELDLSAR